MVHFVETPDDAAQAEPTMEPPRKVVPSRLTVLARLTRMFYVLLSTVFAAGVLVQVFFAGVGAFGADWSYHLAFVHFLEPLPLLMLPTAFVGRLPWSLRLLPLVVIFLIGAQYAFAHATVPAAALHPMNGVLILRTSLYPARRAWAVVALRTKG